MKILFCTNTYENVLNGPSKFARYLLEMNTRFEDVELRILTEDISEGANNGSVFKLILKPNMWTKPWGFIYRMFPYYWACRDIRQSYPYDIVVFNNAITGIWSALFLKVPVLGMINDDTSVSISLKNFDGSRRWFRHFVFQHLEKLACRLQQGILVNSNYLQEIISKKYDVDHSKLHLLYKGVLIEKERSTKISSFASPIKVLFVKSDYVRGGLPDLIAALGLLRNYEFELRILGPSLIDKQKIFDFGNFSNIKTYFLGPATAIVVQRLMKQSDLFIVPSHNESLGVANLEALNNGVTVISTNIGGIPEVLNNGENGWMVNPGDPDDLAKAILHVINSPEERVRKRQNGYAFVSTHFSYLEVLNRFKEILNYYGT